MMVALKTLILPKMLIVFGYLKLELVKHCLKNIITVFIRQVIIAAKMAVSSKTR